MQEKLINERRDWKAQVFPYDYYLPDDSKSCLYCLTDKQAELLRGLVEPLGWRTRWWSETDAPIELSVIEPYRADLIRRLMMSCCGDEVPVQYRYDPDGNLEKSEDGGVTWTPAPENDVRINSPQFPPVPGADGDDKKCIAATGGAALLKEQVGDQLTDGMSRYTLSQLITDWVGTMLDTSNPFEALLTVISNQIFALVIATLGPALTDPVYDTFKCILYCRMNEAAFFDAAAWAGVRSDITDQIGGIAGIFLEHLVYLLGNGGLTNLVRAGGAASGDCSDCDCPLTCDIDNWHPALWYGGVYYHDGSGAVTGTEIARDATSITIQSADRGDGQQVISFSTPDGLLCCGFTAEFIGTAPAHTLHSFNYCETHAAYETLIPDNTAPFSSAFTMCYLQMDPGSWVIKFTITP